MARFPPEEGKRWGGYLKPLPQTLPVSCRMHTLMDENDGGLIRDVNGAYWIFIRIGNIDRLVLSTLARLNPTLFKFYSQRTAMRFNAAG